MEALNKVALFADATDDYRIPREPDPFKTVTYRFRTAKDNVFSVFLVTRESEYQMEKAETVGDFDYYQVEIPCTDETFYYVYRVHGLDETLFYQETGIFNEPDWNVSYRFKPGFKVPSWAQGAVMYQIFVDRFNNGDPKNDVRKREYYYNYAHSDDVTFWRRDVSPSHVGEFYGGDLQGVINKLDYLEGLGVEVIYFNPIFVSPSYHKYDTQDYDHIDPHFGVIVEEEGQFLADADMDNTHASMYISRVTSKANLEASDMLFAELVKKAHERGMRVIIDGVFNHCGSFHKWMDREGIYAGRPGYQPGAYQSYDSPYRDYFSFGNSDWPYNKSYEGWWGFDTLPKLNYEGSKDLEDQIIRIGRKWVSPPFNADGWRLDVAADLGHSAEYNHYFWKRFRREVKEANPDALILAEHYGDPRPWLEGEEWDTVMNYDAFMDPVSYFLTGVEKHSDEFHGELIGNVDYFKEAMKHNMAQFMESSLLSAMNELSNHDHSRFMTRTNGKIGRVGHLGARAANEGIRPEIMAEAVVLQMTWPGAPTIYYGDEAGLCGFTDPDDRRTYPWGREDMQILEIYRQAISLRKEYKVLRTGSFRFLNCESNMLSYARFNREEQIVVAINNNDKGLSARISVTEAGIPRGAVLTQVFFTQKKTFSKANVDYQLENGLFDIFLPAHSAVVFKRK